ncbi:hypothetical protein NQ317_015942 [Molorchus minor]|uniref:CTLH domain-containing protein n=1 Tax=Molorchus minor TaxID=1323400 RepID=A0ABQ9IVE0_9CUCU|nr:hypothetical protein NQ317_015942 [Molorchus minor]
MKKARNIFDDLDIEDFKENLGQVDTASTSASNYKQEAIASKYIQSDAATSSSDLIIKIQSELVLVQQPSTSAGHSSTPVRTALARPSRSFSSFLEGTAITPIKKDSTKVTADKSEYKDEFEGPESQVVVTSPTKGDVVEWINKLEEDRKQLEKKLDMVIERQRLLRSLRREKSNDEKRPREGILYRSKRTSPRIPLVCLMDSTKPEDTGLNCDLFAVTPDNATYVHFKEELSAVIHTKDGATVVPSLNDVSVPCLAQTPRLLPNGWIKNHYKWIVWKLASYARMFPSQFGGCLNVENVMQQLKYRYDREIDRAENVQP